MPYAHNDGVSISYDVYGAGTPIVFLHPWTLNGGIWYSQVFPFSLTNRVIAVDQRGHGRSDKPRSGYGIDDHAGDVAALLDTELIDRAVIVGNALGGMVALQFALDFPERVKGLVVLSSGTGLGLGHAEELAKDFTGMFSGMVEAGLSAKTKRERPEIALVMKAHLRDQHFPRHVFDAARKEPNGVFGWDITDELANISAPTLVLAGTEDQVTPPEANRVLAESIPGASICLAEDVGHFYQLENPLEFNARVEAFVGSLPK